MAIYIDPPEPRELPSDTIHDLTIDSVRYLGLVGSGVFEPKIKSLIAFRCDDQPDSKGEPILVFGRFTHSLYKDSKLSKLLAAVGVKKPTPPAKLDLEALVGKTLRGLIVYNTGTDGVVYANLERVMPAKPATGTSTTKVATTNPHGVAVSDDDLPDFGGGE